ncbi:hypothetical protein [Marinoscillum sp. MHG1-6]|uniref:DUF7670 domain-containing protein n=1 Tax=Marinoscillum sp. MHG1-6 TaxID=2959627 RepID=UPI00215726E6|nr:hypothetical protein [Marinoscillum sp. MHG1-6]
MKNLSNSTRILLWSARIWGSLILAFILLFVFAHIYGAIFEGRQGNGFQGPEEIFMFACFPVSTVIGLIIGYRSELTGGLISTLAMVCLFTSFFVTQEFSLHHFIEDTGIFLFGILPPCLLYLSYGIMKRSITKVH